MGVRKWGVKEVGFKDHSLAIDFAGKGQAIVNILHAVKIRLKTIDCCEHIVSHHIHFSVDNIQVIVFYAIISIYSIASRKFRALRVFFSNELYLNRFSRASCSIAISPYI